MERYYKILGISNGASKDEIKRAYHAKMKVLHPDKVHGTPLEDTATFFAAEINEAYNYLISHPNQEHTISNQKESPEYMEKDIFIEDFGLLKYSLSNDLNIIRNAMFMRTGQKFLDKIEWRLNPYLSENVKRVMNKHHVNYSMTTYIEQSDIMLVINKRSGNNWYSAFFGEDQEYYAKDVSSSFYKNYNKRKQTKTAVKKNRRHYGFTIAIIIFILIARNVWKNDAGGKGQHKPAAPAVTAAALNSNINISEHANINKTLRTVAEWLRQKADVNGDGLTNHIDAAVLFYQYYPDKSKVCIEINNNPKTGMNHLFNCVFTNGVWKAVEPQAYANNRSNYFMWSVWGSQYDNSYNRNVTSDYLRYVRK